MARDQGTPLEETIRAANFLIENGSTFYWGCDTSWKPKEVVEAREMAQRLGMIGPAAGLCYDDEVMLPAAEKIFAALRLGTMVQSSWFLDPGDFRARLDSIDPCSFLICNDIQEIWRLKKWGSENGWT